MPAAGNTAELASILARQPVIPLVQAGDAATAVAIARALDAAGMRVLEVVQRTDASLECLGAVADALPDAIIGAGTVLSPEQAESCLARGARFIVSPGLDDDIVATAQAHGVAVFPGIMTPSELQHAHRLGLAIVKFFPASTAGGVAALRGLASVFRGMQFIPTGGISAANLGEYLALPSVLACGGSWMTPRQAVANEDFAQITALARAALALASTAGRQPSP
jgi:2-dehydro-3-deoxyphosphogluconate aldolase/(4S)-4-hydroxy-2-oxoglutarate aldolase